MVILGGLLVIVLTRKLKVRNGYKVLNCEEFDKQESEYPVCDALEGIPGVSVVSYNHGCFMKNELPSLVFSSSPEVGYLISLLLNRSALNKETRFNWGIFARFSNEGVLQFHITLRDNRFFSLSFLFILLLNFLRRDLERMSHLLRTERALYLCNTKELWVCPSED